jgi:hypothetical protein
MCVTQKLLPLFSCNFVLSHIIKMYTRHDHPPPLLHTHPVYLTKYISEQNLLLTQCVQKQETYFVSRVMTHII